MKTASFLLRQCAKHPGSILLAIATFWGTWPPPAPGQCPVDAALRACDCGQVATDLDHNQILECSDPFQNPSHSSIRPTFHLVISDPDQRNVSDHADIQRVLKAACDEWAGYILSDATITVQVDFSETGSKLIMSAGAASNIYVGNQNGYQIWQNGVIAKLAGQADPNGDQPDAIIHLNPQYLGSLWFDSTEPIDPSAQPVPANRYDAYSVFLHELGHILGMNGWLFASTTTGKIAPRLDEQDRPIPLIQPMLADKDTAASNSKSATPSSIYLSVYDLHVVEYTPDDIRFVGPNVQQICTDGIPLTDNYVHLDSPHAVMSPIMEFGIRHRISLWELAILADTGLPVAIPAEQCIPDEDRDGDGIADCIDPTLTADSIPADRSARTLSPSPESSTSPTSTCGVGTTGAALACCLLLMAMKQRR